MRHQPTAKGIPRMREQNIREVSLVRFVFFLRRCCAAFVLLCMCVCVAYVCYISQKIVCSLDLRRIVLKFCGCKVSSVLG